MNRLSLVLSVLVMACSSSSSSAPPGAAPEGGAGDGAGAVPDAGGTADGPGGGGTTCGPPPYVNVGLIVRSASSTGADGNPIEGAKLTTSLCPGVEVVSAADGTMNAQISKGTPFY